jgi:hypothetical protein
MTSATLGEILHFLQVVFSVGYTVLRWLIWCKKLLNEALDSRFRGNDVAVFMNGHDFVNAQ